VGRNAGHREGALYLQTDATKGRIRKSRRADKKSATALRLYRFRVAAPNRTLKHEVVFTGIFSPLPIRSPPRQPAAVTRPGRRGPRHGRRTVLLELRKARMEGIAGWPTNKIAHHALPVRRERERFRRFS